MSIRNSWKTLDGESVADIENFIEEEIKAKAAQNCQTFIFIGTDSQNVRDRVTSFVQVVCLHFIDKGTGLGIGGRVIYIRHIESIHKSKMKRLLREAEISLNLAKKVEPIITKYDLPFEIHADVNSDPTYESNIAHDTVKGWVTSMGYKCVTKPDAWVASIVADRHTKGFSRKERKEFVERIRKNGTRANLQM